MVDAQAPGLGSYIRRLQYAIGSGEGWQLRSTDILGRLGLLLAAGEKLSSLSPDFAADVRTALGWTQSKEEALATTAIADSWQVIGQVTQEEERLRVRRTWLLGRTTGRRALILDFAAGPAPLDSTLISGTRFDGELCFYSGRLQLRALVKSRAATSALDPSLGPGADASAEDALRTYADALALNPWLSTWPIVFELTPARRGRIWSLADRHGASLPLAPRFSGLWRMISLSGGAPLHIAGEWDGDVFTPLGVLPSAASTTFEDLASRWAA
jgi:hypothetical protein